MAEFYRTQRRIDTFADLTDSTTQDVVVSVVSGGSCGSNIEIWTVRNGVMEETLSSRVPAVGLTSIATLLVTTGWSS